MRQHRFIAVDNVITVPLKSTNLKEVEKSKTKNSKIRNWAPDSNLGPLAPTTDATDHLTVVLPPKIKINKTISCLNWY